MGHLREVFKGQSDNKIEEAPQVAHAQLYMDMGDQCTKHKHKTK